MLKFTHIDDFKLEQSLINLKIVIGISIIPLMSDFVDTRD